VQGVGWDPHGEYVVSQSGDRTARVFASRGMGAEHKMLSARWCKHLACQKVLKSADSVPDPKEEAPTAADGEKPPRAPLFHDDTMGSFFRRPAWSPCGSFLAVPAGVHREHAGAKEQHCTYLYARDAFHRPALRLPGIAPAACVRFSPVFYERKGDAFSAKTRPRTPEKKDAQCFDAVDAPALTGDDTADAKAHGVSDASAPNLGSSIDLPFRVLFAVCTTDTVAVYDSGSDAPVAFVGGLHYAAITDAAWSPDGYTLVVSSSDGYCSVLQFSEREIGEPLVQEKLPEHLRRLTPAARVRAAREAAAEAARRAAAAAEEAAAKAKAKAEAKAETEAPAPAPPVEPPAPAAVAAVDAPKRVAPEPVRRVAPEPATGVGEGAAAATASFAKRAAPDAVPADAPPAKAPKRVAPTAL
jgi:chromatin assembly factor 1 subunit B